jgi:DJ-1 family protein
MDKSILVPISSGTEEIEAVVIINLLRRAGVSVKIAGDNEIVSGSRKIRMLPDLLIENIRNDMNYDGIIIPGGSTGVKHLSENNQLIDIIKRHYKNGALIGAICAAPIIFSIHKFIDKKTVLTSHPSVRAELGEFKYVEQAVVVDKNIITSRGAGTAIQFTLTIIEMLGGQELANKIANDIVF